MHAGESKQVDPAGSDRCGQGAYLGLLVGTAQLSGLIRSAKLSGALRVVYNDVRYVVLSNSGVCTQSEIALLWLWHYSALQW
jgi:hypothetical protein